jgi:hypothetical protein
MINFLIGSALYLLQIWLVFHGVDQFGIARSPAVLLATSLALGVWYGFVLLTQRTPDGAAAAEAPRRARWLGAFLGLLSMALAYEEWRKCLVRYADYKAYSDVLPQLEALAARFGDGVFPYTPVDVQTHIAYPVYMPLHWLPVMLPQALAFDVRWIGYVALGLAAAFYGYAVVRTRAGLPAQLAAAVLPSLGLWGYILWGEIDLPVTLETLVAAYYLVLGASLCYRHAGWIVAGVILALLSRYTLVFWLPLLALLVWRNWPRRAVVRAAVAIALSVLLLYVVPFLLRDPTILRQGVAYHNNAAVAEWTGYGDPPVSWSFQRGLHFAGLLRDLFPGTMEQRVYYARLVQGVLMLALLATGWLAYRRWRGRVHYYDLALLWLYLTVVLFYAFGPLTYRYYLLVQFVLAACLCGRLASGARPLADGSPEGGKLTVR